MIVIGDCHGKTQQYMDIISKNIKEKTFQVGDFGYKKSWTELKYSGLDPDLHLVGQGNHDPHDILCKDNFLNFAGRWGWVESHGVFWIGGSLSIDQTYRVGEWYSDRSKERTWFPQEQLGFQEMLECKALFSEIKPEIVLSHDSPVWIHITGSNKTGGILDRYGLSTGNETTWNNPTQEFLSHLFDRVHKPKKWVHGHYHKSLRIKINGTDFYSLGELEYVNIG